MHNYQVNVPRSIAYKHTFADKKGHISACCMI